MRLLSGFGRVIDLIAELAGRVGWVLVLYCMIFGVSDVFLRYALNAPSQWIGTTIQAAMVLIACVGGPYALKHDAFVKLDMFYARAKRRNRALLDIATAPFALLFLSVLIWKGWGAAMVSMKIKQVTPTAIAIPIYPIKIAIPIAAALVLLIVLKQLLRDLRTVFTGGPEKEEPA